jgi:hypothetical protein
VALLGIGVFAVPFGIVASAYFETRRNSPEPACSKEELMEETKPSASSR